MGCTSRLRAIRWPRSTSFVSRVVMACAQDSDLHVRTGPARLPAARGSRNVRSAKPLQHMSLAPIGPPAQCTAELLQERRAALDISTALQHLLLPQWLGSLALQRVPRSWRPSDVSPLPAFSPRFSSTLVVSVLAVSSGAHAPSRSTFDAWSTRQWRTTAADSSPARVSVWGPLDQ